MPKSFQALRIFVLILTGMLCSGCYVIRLSYEQNNLMNGRRPIDDVIRDEKTRPEARDRLQFIKKVIQFASTEGLNVQGAYRYFVEIQGEAISYTVHAAEPFELKAKEWWFPVVGSVPYRGYFTLEEARAFAEELQRSDYDVEINTVAAFSSLGWFDDPIYSTMLKSQPFDIAQTLFHELTHRTLWLHANVDFNENIAEFVGTRLAREFLKSDPEMEKNYMAKKRDQEIFATWLKGFKKTLGEFYDTHKNDPAIRALKKNFFETELKRGRSRFAETSRYRKLFDRPWNNATVIGFGLYTPDTELFERAYQCSHAKNMGEFLTLVDGEADRSGDGFLALKHICAKS